MYCHLHGWRNQTHPCPSCLQNILTRANYTDRSPDNPAPKEPTMAAPPPVPALDRQEGGGHYKAMKIQPFEYIHANSIPFAEGCVVKYVTRWRAKGGVEDLRKARHFLDLLIEAETNKPEGTHD